MNPKNQIPPRKPRIIPPITSEPIWPETFALTACIRMKFWSSSSRAIFCTTRLAIGNAEIPLAVSPANATSPRIIIRNVCVVRKFSAVMLAPTLIPSRSVTMFESSFCATEESFSNTPHSRSRFPNIRNPIRAATSGIRMLTAIVAATGNEIIIHFGMFLFFAWILVVRSFSRFCCKFKIQRPKKKDLLPDCPAKFRIIRQKVLFLHYSLKPKNQTQF